MTDITPDLYALAGFEAGYSEGFAAGVRAMREAALRICEDAGGREAWGAQGKDYKRGAFGMSLAIAQAIRSLPDPEQTTNPPKASSD